MGAGMHEDVLRMMQDPIVVAISRSLPPGYVFQPDFSNIVAADDEYARRGGRAPHELGSVAMAVIRLRSAK